MPETTETEFTISHVPADVFSRLERTAAKFGQSVSDFVLAQADEAAAFEEEQEKRSLAAYRSSVERSKRGEQHPAGVVLTELRQKHFSKPSPNA